MKIGFQEAKKLINSDRFLDKTSKSMVSTRSHSTSRNKSLIGT